MLVLAYMYKTVPEICSIGPDSSGQGSSEQQHQQWPLAWRLVCGSVPGSIEILQALELNKVPAVNSTAAASVAAMSGGGSMMQLLATISNFNVWILASAAATAVQFALTLCRVVSAIFFTGLLSGNVIHNLVPAMQFVHMVLLLAPIPYPHIGLLWHSAKACIHPTNSGDSTNNTPVAMPRSSGSSKAGSSSTTSTRTQQKVDGGSSGTPGGSNSCSSLIAWYHPDTYWRYPLLRQATIMGVRLVPCISAAADAKAGSGRYLAATMRMNYWAQGSISTMV